MNLPFSSWVYVRSHNLGIERHENKKERHKYSASVYGLYLHIKTLFSLHIFPYSFNRIQDSIYIKTV